MKSEYQITLTHVKKIIFVSAFFCFLFSCKKKEGVGGKASINGKVLVKHYSKNYTTLISQYYGPNVEVFIIYGDDIDYGTKINTNFDGAYEFKYLRPGNYKIYTYSKDSSSVSGKTPIILDINIPKNNSVIEAQDLEILN